MASDPLAVPLLVGMRFDALSATPSAIAAASGGPAADAKTVVGLMLLGAVRGTAITITAEGEDEVAAVTALAELVARGFDEEETEAPQPSDRRPSAGARPRARRPRRPRTSRT